MAIKIRPVSLRSYQEAINGTGDDSYRIYESGSFPSGVNYPAETQFIVFACSGLTMDYRCGNVNVQSGSQIIIMRTLRTCEHDGNPHYNADDRMIIPGSDGGYYIISRKDSSDHYYNLANLTGSLSIADAYNLPDEFSGSIGNYTQSGANWPSIVHDLEPFS